MYDYRQMTAAERAAVVKERKRRGFPWHRPPHPEAPGEYRIVTGACFEHRALLDSPERRTWFETELLETVKKAALACAAWCVLPNHYHILVQIADIKAFGKALGRLHGATAFALNGQDKARGRKVWCNYEDRCMRSDAHFYTCLNYIHNNPVKHCYVKKWQDWPHSSVHWYLATHGRAWLLDLWLQHPVRDFGKGWDD